eukprot:COSAG06_NODE_6535_length_2891_cov_2.769341_1_plen_216_part_00
MEPDLDAREGPMPRRKTSMVAVRRNCPTPTPPPHTADKVYSQWSHSTAPISILQNSKPLPLPLVCQKGGIRYYALDPLAASGLPAGALVVGAQWCWQPATATPCHCLDLYISSHSICICWPFVKNIRPEGSRQRCGPSEEETEEAGLTHPQGLTSGATTIDYARSIYSTTPLTQALSTRPIFLLPACKWLLRVTSFVNESATPPPVGDGAYLPPA